MSKIIAFILAFTLPIHAIAECKSNIPGHDPTRYQSKEDGTVVDLVTKLMWMRCDLGAQWDATLNQCVTTQTIKKVKGTWPQALAETEKLNNNGGFAGFTDWRMPNIKEMMSLVMLNCYPTIDPTAFPGAEASYWTSTPSKAAARYLETENKINAEGKIERLVLVDRYETAAWSAHIQGSSMGKTIITPMSEKNYVRLVRNTTGGGSL